VEGESEAGEGEAVGKYFHLLLAGTKRQESCLATCCGGIVCLEQNRQ
jgi:hypothetical protein